MKKLKGEMSEDKIKDINDKIAENLLKNKKKVLSMSLMICGRWNVSKEGLLQSLWIRKKLWDQKPKTKTEVTTPEEIKRVSLQYCVDLLTNRQPKEDFAEDVLVKENVHLIRIEE